MEHDQGQTGAEGIPGGTAEPPAPSPTAGGPPPGEPAPGSGQQFGPIPYPRFKEVNDDLGEWRKFGKREEIAQRLERLERYERAIEESRRRQAEAQAAQDPAQRVWGQFNDVAPAFRGIDREMPLLEQVQQRMVVTINRLGASDELGSLLKAASIELTPGQKSRLEDDLLEVMTPEELARLDAGDRSVVKPVLERSWFGKLTTRAGPPNGPPPTPPLRHGPAGGQPPKGPPAAPDTKDRDAYLAHARSVGHARLKASEG